MTVHGRRRVVALLVGVLLASGAVACGDDDDGDDGGAAAGGSGGGQGSGSGVRSFDDPLSDDPATLVGEAPEQESVRSAIPGLSILWAPFLIAQDEGLFEKHGLDVEEVQAESTRTLDLYLADEVDISFAVPGTVSAVLAARQDIDVYSLIQEHISYGFYVRPEIESLDDLEGGVIGISGVGGVPEQAARALLDAEGFDAGDVNFQPLGGIGDILTGMVSGNVDAGAFGNPLATLAERQGMVRLFDLPEYDFPIAGGPVIADPGWVEDNPNTALAWLRAFFEGMQIAITDEETTKRILAERLDLDPDEDADVLDASYEELLVTLPSPAAGSDLGDLVDYFRDGFEEPERVPDPSVVVPDEGGVLDELEAERYFERLEAVYGPPPPGSYAAESE